ncbi:hypothetical protein [Chitinophaga flava]|uniref:Uncharacterized protein n=1 Tax=Chitinophaga flava TaxID=2259036 RepID=A0A365XYF3_9BACT|nr:hypothetical protein [Chitinophaga flava]RBL90724.1 hypothetical protein DF182_30230 [Chitinophaga flava]
MKVTCLLLAAGISAIMLTSCGNGAQPNQDSMKMDNNAAADTAAILPDTAAEETPPGGINPGEDPAHAGDSSKNPTHKHQ